MSAAGVRGRRRAGRCRAAPPSQRKKAAQHRAMPPAPAGGIPFRLRLSEMFKTVAVGGHAPTTATPTGKFCGKLCARSIATSARFAVKFCRRGYTRGNSRVRRLPCAAVSPCAACRVSRHAEAPAPGGCLLLYRGREDTCAILRNQKRKKAGI